MVRSIWILISRSCIGQRVHGTHTSNHLPEHCIFTVERSAIVVHVNIELRASTDAGPRTRHCKVANIIVKRAIVLEGHALRRGSLSPSVPVSSAVYRVGVTRLNYKAGDNSVPYKIIVEVSVGETHEIADSFWSLRSVEFDDYRSVRSAKRSVDGCFDHGSH